MLLLFRQQPGAKSDLHGNFTVGCEMPSRANMWARPLRFALIRVLPWPKGLVSLILALVYLLQRPRQGLGLSFLFLVYLQLQSLHLDSNRRGYHG